MRNSLLLAVLLALLTTACQVDAVVDVEVGEDGSGVVRLTVAFDEQIIDAAPELRDGLRVEDLERAGWKLEGPREAESGGSISYVAEKEFVSPDHLQAVLDEISGASGLFTGFAVERSRSFARTTYTVTGRIDPSIDLTSFGDDAIAGLVNDALGTSLAELETRAGRPLSETVSLGFSVRLPDTVETVSGTADRRTASWLVRAADPLPTDIEVTSSVEDQLPRVWAAVALVALALLGTLLVFRVLARLSGRPSQRGGSSDDVQMRRPEKAAGIPETASTARARPPRLELVVLDARGVLYDEANDIGARLVPFVRERGGRASLQEINDVCRAASLGRLSTAELWSQLGLGDDAAELDDAYTQEFTLRPGVIEFIDRLHERGLRVAVITNNVLGWSKTLRQRFELDERVDTWVVSGEIGARKPDSAFFEALRRMTGVEYSDSLLIDDQIDDLDTARSLGMSTAMFVPSESQLPTSSPHPIVHGFDSFFGRRN